MLTEEQYEERLLAATGLTAIGLKQGRSYHHKGVSVFPVTLMHKTEYHVDPFNGLTRAYDNPFNAAIHFVDLVTERYTAR